MEMFFGFFLYLHIHGLLIKLEELQRAEMDKIMALNHGLFSPVQFNSVFQIFQSCRSVHQLPKTQTNSASYFLLRSSISFVLI